MVISGRSQGGDARMHTFLMTGIYKGIFVKVLGYAWFYKSEIIHAYPKSKICVYIHFKDELQF